jgi:hypothetical protein
MEPDGIVVQPALLLGLTKPHRIGLGLLFDPIAGNAA